MSNITLTLLCACVLLACVVAPPVKEKRPGEHGNDVSDDQYPQEIFTMEYARYLKEVVDTLEEDKSFREKLQNASEDEIKSGNIADELVFVSHNVRSKLDEIKRQEVDRIRKAAREQMELSQGLDRRQIKIPKHLDHRNQETFEIEDLRKLILQTTRDLEETDRKRKTEFKEYEMEKERRRLEKMKAFDEEHKKRAQQEYEEQMRKHKDHPKLHHPGSKQQLEEVWEKQDHFPANEFNPKLFFKMHDLDGDNMWSMDEVNALFQNELNKMYDPNASEDDMKERYEEMERMREHVFNETDTNRDGLISFGEFMDQATKQEFEQDPGWQGLDEQTLYSRDEYEEYVRRQHEDRARMAAAGINSYGGPMGHPDPAQGMYPNHIGYQPIPPQPQGRYPQQPMHPQGYAPQHVQNPAQAGYQQGLHAPYQPEHQQQFQQVPQQQFQQQQQQHIPQQQQQHNIPQQQQIPQQQHVPQQQQDPRQVVNAGAVEPNKQANVQQQPSTDNLQKLPVQEISSSSAQSALKLEADAGQNPKT